MSDKPSPFDAIFAENSHLLASKAVAPTRSTEDEIAVAHFEAINAFIDMHNAMPGSTENGREPGLQEYTLEAHLATFRENSQYHTLLAPYDRHGLLGAAPEEAPPTSIAAILASNDPLLHDSAEQIFDLRHVATTPAKSAETPDEIAQRRPCLDFATFAPVFSQIDAELASGRRKTVSFEGEASIKPGAIFVFRGLTAYIAEVSTKERRGMHYNARLRVIFSNGTESNLLLRSFARALYHDDHPRQIVEADPSISGPLFTGQPAPGDPQDRYTGNIYVVESLSKEPSIVELRGRLYKIGFTTQRIDQRLANVEADPTFLLAPVRVVKTFETVNLNPRKLEALLHQFFAHARLNVNVLLGRTVNPREWFVVPLDLVSEAIQRILDGSILRYRYDQISRKILPR